MRSQVGHLPVLSTEHTASIGEPILSHFDYVAQRGAILTHGYAAGFGLGDIRVPVKQFLQEWTSGDSTQWCTPGYGFFGLGGPSTVCFGDSDNDQSFDRVRVPPVYFGSWRERPIGPYVIADHTQMQGSKRELIYQGLHDNVIKVAYREYQNDLIRPAFQQEVSYTLDRLRPTSIGFQGARLSILSASNTAIRFKVEKSFD